MRKPPPRATAGPSIDYAAARVHYQKALEGNVPSAGLRLGLLLLDGWGGPADRAGAVQLIQSSAEAGNRAAQRIVSAMYFAGFGLPHDLELAAAWQQRAEESDVAAVAAADSLPERLRRHDYEAELAERWFELAAENDYRAGLTATVASLAQADVESNELTLGSQWLENAAAESEPNAQWLLASLYLVSPQFQQQADLIVQAHTLLINARTGGSYDAARVIENEVPGVSLEQAADQSLTSPARSNAAYPDAAVLPSGDLQPKPYRTIYPLYPRSMRIAHVEGQVVVDFIVDPTGRVRRAFAVKPYQTEFAEAAVLSVNQWRFQPGRRDGHPVFVHLQVPVVFQLNQPSEFNLDGTPAIQ